MSTFSITGNATILKIFSLNRFHSSMTRDKCSDVYLFRYRKSNWASTFRVSQMNIIFLNTTALMLSCQLTDVDNFWCRCQIKEIKNAFIWHLHQKIIYLSTSIRWHDNIRGVLFKKIILIWLTLEVDAQLFFPWHIRKAKKKLCNFAYLNV